MGVRNHVRNNWVEYLVLAVLVYFGSKNKTVRKYTAKIIAGTNNKFKGFLKEGSNGKKIVAGAKSTKKKKR